MTTINKTLNFYGAGVPRRQDIVFVEISASENSHNDKGYLLDSIPGVVVYLLEYGMITGLIQLEELSCKRKNDSVSSPVKGLRIGKRFAVEVTAVDDTKDRIYIDLSKKAIADSKIRQDAQVKFDKAVKLNKIIRTCAEACGLAGDAMIIALAWPFHTASSHAFDVLQTFAHSLERSEAICKFKELCASEQMAELIFAALIERPQKSASNKSAVDTSQAAEQAQEQEQDEEPESLQQQALDLVVDAMTKLGDFSADDIRHTIKLQLIDFRTQHDCDSNDCAFALLQACFQIALYDSLQALRSNSASPALRVKEFRNALECLLKLWAPVVRQLLDNRVMRWDTSSRTLVHSGQFELLCWLSEHCFEHNQSFDSSKLFVSLLSLLYDEMIDLLDEDTILHWTEYATQSGTHDEQLKSVRPFIDWLAQQAE
jgi:hypothetical protein